MLYRDPANPIEKVEPHPKVGGTIRGQEVEPMGGAPGGYWLGRGYSARETADKLEDGTSEGTVKGQARRAGIQPEKAKETVVPIHLPYWQRDIIARHAADRGLSMDELISHMLESALVLDDLYDAVTDGRYQTAVKRD